LKGADIGDNCVIGAGCIIKDVIHSGSLVRPNCHHVIEPIRS
jgi:carbonic anhydrase/acetyltransferase-like protein (isoleucine patch superfamily)